MAARIAEGASVPRNEDLPANASPVKVGPRCIALLSSQFDMAFLVPAFQACFPGAELRLNNDLGRLSDIDAAVCWAPAPGLLASMPGLKLIQSLGAGVDHLASDPDLPDVPVCRIIDPDMASGMTAYVAWAVIQHQRCMRGYLDSAARGAWEEQPIRPPRTHTVGIAGMGELGRACARVLLALGYRVRGWSRQPKSDLPAGVDGFYGEQARATFLSGCDTLVCLLPLTADTKGVLCAGLFDQLPVGAHLINVGRGDHLVQADLLAALASGQLSAATLDTFSQEPLPADHPFWRDPRITITPHVATRTSPRVIARQTLTHFQQIDAGEHATGAVDLKRGY